MTKKIILASGSPRRRQLLEYIIPEIIIAPSRSVDEAYPQELPADEVPIYLSRLKAEAYLDLVTEDSIVITADTVVILDDQILGKPKDANDAINMLTSLSGRGHRVVTGVTVLSSEKAISFSETTDVLFDDVSNEDIKWYVDNYKPYDKAGSYGIQEWIGCIAISKIEGCYYNVMGLPLHSLYQVLKSDFAYTGSTSK